MSVFKQECLMLMIIMLIIAQCTKYITDFGKLTKLSHLVLREIPISKLMLKLL